MKKTKDKSIVSINNKLTNITIGKAKEAATIEEKDAVIKQILMIQEVKKKIKANYAKAYTEVLEIIKYFPKKIPIEKIEFYKKI